MKVQEGFWLGTKAAVAKRRKSQEVGHGHDGITAFYVSNLWTVLLRGGPGWIRACAMVWGGDRLMHVGPGKVNTVS